jgi:hypothetical protein
LKNALLDVEPKLASRCAGILEVVNFEEEKTHTIEHVLSRAIKRPPWGSIGVEFIHKSAKDFLLSMKHRLLNQDVTTHAERKSRVLQAIALEDLYYVNKPGFHRMDQSLTMYMITRTEPQLPDKEELNILILIQEVYQRSRWSEFHELACQYGFYQPPAHLLKSSSGDFSALLNYLLVCASSGFTKRNYTTVSYFLDMGANPDYVAFIAANHGRTQCHRPHESFLYLPVPLLGIVLKQNIPRIFGETMGFTPPVVEMIHLFITFGADIERKFLFKELRAHFSRFGATVDRPVCDVTIFSEVRRVSFLAEMNCVDLILAELAQSRNVAYGEKMEIIKHLGLDVARAHHKILLCFCGDIAYGVNDEDTGTMNEIWNWEQSRMPQEDEVNIEEDDGYTLGSYDSVYSDDSEDVEDGDYSDDIYDLEDKKRFRKPMNS